MNPRMLAPLSKRQRLQVARAILTAIDDGGKVQTAQVKLFDAEAREAAEVLMQYGFTSRLPGVGEGLYFAVGGDRDHGVLGNAAWRKYRPRDLPPGEVVLYTDEDEGASDHRIHFKRGKVIEIVAGVSKIVIGPGGITITTPALDIVKG